MKKVQGLFLYLQFNYRRNYAERKSIDEGGWYSNPAAGRNVMKHIRATLALGNCKTETVAFPCADSKIKQMFAHRTDDDRYTVYVDELTEPTWMRPVEKTYPGEYLLPAKLTANGADANGILESLTVGKKAISVTLGSFAQGLSGKLETGDIVSVIVYRAKEGAAVTPPELQYLRVITSTTSQGVDKANITDSTQPVTVTLLVNQAQAELLSAYEKSASMHFALEYRGDAETAAQYLAVQEDYFRNGGSHE